MFREVEKGPIIDSLPGSNLSLINQPFVFNAR